MADAEQVAAILDELIAFPTVSSESNLELIAYASERLGAAGAAISIFRDASGHKANMVATLGPEQAGGLMLAGHTDVVPVVEADWTGDPFRMRRDKGRLYGRGACDMKGFLACALAAAEDYAQLDLTRPVHLVFTFDEEIGCLGARELTADLARMDLRPAAAIIGEPTMMQVVDGHKGCCEYTTTFTGLAGHGSDPGAGVNAVEYAARYVGRLLELAEDMKARAPAHSPFEPPWTTIQTGRLEGGVARNVIAAHSRLEWEMRPVTRADQDHVKSQMEEFCASVLRPAMQAVSPLAGIDTETIGEVDGLHPEPDNLARRLVAEITGANGAEQVAFGTEAGLYQSLGMSAVVCGPGSIEQAHKPDEYVSLDQIEACLAMLSGLAGWLTAPEGTPR